MIHTASQRAFISGSGEMAERIRSLDWSTTPLGSIEDWPDTLLSSVQTTLACPLPTQLFWGPAMVMFYNDAARSLLSERHPRDLGRTAEQAWSEIWSFVGPRFEAVLAHGETFYEQNSLLPVLRDGRMQDTYWTYSYSPVYAPSGDILAISVVFQDDTRKNMAEKARDAASAQLKQVLEVTTDSVLAIDRDWKISYLNPRARQTIAGVGDVLNMYFYDAFPATLYEGSPYVVDYRRAMYESIPCEFESYYPEPLNIWVHVQARPSEDGIIVFFRDITQVKQSTAALLEAEKLAAVGRLAASIAHEINNPLESVTNLLYLARLASDRAEADGYLESAERELGRVAVISNQTLRFYKQASHPRAVTSEELFSSVLEIYQGRVGNLLIHIECERLSPTPVLCFDGEIRQVLNNLVGNAIDAMKPAGGRLILRSSEVLDPRSQKKGLQLTVADTGPGISPGALKQIFQAFFTTKGLGGTGLGLWVSKEIAERHNGSLKVRSSQSPAHHGTIFNLTLPFDAVVRP